MAFKDMREYLSMLEEDGQLKHVDTPINCEYEKNELQSLSICTRLTVRVSF